MYYKIYDFFSVEILENKKHKTTENLFRLHFYIDTQSKDPTICSKNLVGFILHFL